jgi:hypothetical protein
MVHCWPVNSGPSSSQEQEAVNEPASEHDIQALNPRRIELVRLDHRHPRGFSVGGTFVVSPCAASASGTRL